MYVCMIEMRVKIKIENHSASMFRLALLCSFLASIGCPTLIIISRQKSFERIQSLRFMAIRCVNGGVVCDCESPITFSKDASDESDCQKVMARTMSTECPPSRRQTRTGLGERTEGGDIGTGCLSTHRCTVNISELLVPEGWRMYRWFIIIINIIIIITTITITITTTTIIVIMAHCFSKRLHRVQCQPCWGWYTHRLPLKTPRSSFGSQDLSFAMDGEQFDAWAPQVWWRFLDVFGCWHTCTLSGWGRSHKID